MEFHIARRARDRYGVDEVLFNYAGNVVFANVAASRVLAQRVNEVRRRGLSPEAAIAVTLHAGSLFAMGLIDELSHAMVARYRETLDPAVLPEALRWFASKEGTPEMDALLARFAERFPTVAVYRGELSTEQWLAGSSHGMAHREAAFEEMMLLWLANANPAFRPFAEFFDDREVKDGTVYTGVVAALDTFFATRPEVAPEVGTLLDALRAPMLAAPGSLTGQLEYIREHWAEHLGEELRQILRAIDVVKEEDIAIWMQFHPGGTAGGTRPGQPGEHAGPGGSAGWRDEGFVGDEYIGFTEATLAQSGARTTAPGAHELPVVHEYEAFSEDQAWMPTVVLIAKSTYVWLEQLSKKYQRHIHRLDQIPDEELALLADRGLNGLWLIGLWERSVASQTIKRMRGQADAVASAYSVADYRIADDLGGDDAYRILRDRAAAQGLRLASDMVPNHMGLDSTWVMEHPEWFLSVPESPFPVYTFEGPDLSPDPRVEIKIEDHYFDLTDAAVVFRRRELLTGDTRFVYHGNDGTTFAWNDTAQLDYSQAEVREHVMQTILAVARLFPIIRFDAAMVLAKKHVQRLWFPIPGVGGSIPSRAEWSMSNADFDRLMPHEFWREVVDRVALEVPGTLLLAEAFWLLEGYFVRTLGMHRVYNSAFMNMLRDEENAKYRSYLKKTIEFDPDILKRYVNFMSNPDERTAIDQFGTGDRYFGVCTLLATLPGLPMFGHGQIEAFTEKYGMEYKRARVDESPNEGLVARHQREIAPLLKNRKLYAESSNFVLYDLWTPDGVVDENVFAYSNRMGDERAVILFHNRYAQTRGTLHVSAASMDKATGELRSRQLAEALGLAPNSGGRVVAYKDMATGLEYLRHTWQIEQQGLTFDLRAYQYAVLGSWRELKSTADQPWDRLCDGLHGAGVYHLDEALATLRLRPVHQALRAMLEPETLHGVLEASAAILRQTLPELEGANEDLAALTDVSAVTPEPTQPEPTATESLEAQGHIAAQAEALADFSRRAEEFLLLAVSTLGLSEPRRPVERAPLVAPLEGDPLSDLGGDLDELEAAADTPHQEPIAVWAPALTWTVLRMLPGGPAAAFDALQLRQALAEIYPSLGIEGERAWRTAARLRILLAHLPSDPPPLAQLLTRDTFWADPDVRWLAGLTDFEGRTFLHRERFAELLDWLRLPGRMEGHPETDWPTLLAHAESAAFDLHRFRALLAPPPPETTIPVVEAADDPLEAPPDEPLDATAEAPNLLSSLS